MKLTEKDKTFLETLKTLMDSKDLWVELRPDNSSYMILRGTYGGKIHKSFRMTRQGVRWRFWRVMNDIYVSAFDYGERHVMHSIVGVSWMPVP